MNFYWNEVPFLRIIIPMIAGIISYHYFPSTHWEWQIIIIILLALTIFSFHFVPLFYKYKFSLLCGLFLQLLMLACGYMLCLIHSIDFSKNWYVHSYSESQYAIVYVKQNLEDRPKTKKAIVEVMELIKNNESQLVKGEALIYFQKSKKTNELKQGDVLIVKNAFKYIQSLGNPGEFDYRIYCNNKGIYQSAFLRENDWQKSSVCRKNFLYYFNRMGNYTLKILQKFIPDKKSLGIAEALLIGYKGDIDKETWNNYSSSGIAHIIAISGMHMALIFQSMRWLFLLIPYMRKRLILSLTLSLLFMWIFACMTGLPPSVLRASLMFTFLAIGEMFRREVNGLNNLAISACCLLSINPFWLFDVGFQLSYLAVLSLILFYKMIYIKCYFENKLIDAIWKILAGTIAAQILTLPLCIYYFHQFPLLFLLSNLIAIPLSSIILYCEIILLFFAWLKPFASFLGLIISKSISGLNQLIHFIAKLSFASWRGLQIDLLQTCLLFMLIICISIWLIHQKKSYFISALGLFCCLLITFTFHKIQQLKQSKMLVYSCQGNKLIEFIQDDKYYSPDEKLVMNPKEAQQNIIASSHLFLGVHQCNASIVQEAHSKHIDLFDFQTKYILRMKDTLFKSNQQLTVDYLILSEKAFPRREWFMANFNAKQIIIDSSIPIWKMHKIKEELAMLKIPIHCVNTEGAFILNL